MKTIKKLSRAWMTLLAVAMLLSFSGLSASAASAPAAVKNLRRYKSSDSSITLRWDLASGAKGYELFVKDKDSDKYVLAAQTTAHTFTMKDLEAGETYIFKIRSYANGKNDKIYSAFSAPLKVKANSYAPKKQSVHAAYYNATLRKTVTVKNTVTGKKMTLKRGTKVIAKDQRNTVSCYINSKKQFKVARRYISFNSLNVTTKDLYSVDTREDFVNKRGVSSKTNYLIWISQYSLRVNVFKGSKGNWKLVRSIPCIVGKLSTRTARGFSMQIEPTTLRNGAYGGPQIFFTKFSQKHQGACAFHNFVDGNRRGALSNGCVRMSYDNLLWIYNNCKVGTRVISY